MIPSIEEKQIAIRLNEMLINRLDVLSRNSGLNRNHLMLNLVRVWLDVLNKVSMPGLFYIASLLRERHMQMECCQAYEHEFTESPFIEKPLPLKFSESEIFQVNTFMCVNQISRHLLLKTMIIVGIEELEMLVDRQAFQFSEIEGKLHRSFKSIMERSFKALKAYLK